MQPRIVPLEAAHAEDAASLVASRYREERAAHPLVSDAYSDGAAIEPRLRDLLASNRGVAATRDGELVAFLVGMAIDWRGWPTVYVPEFGHGADPAGAYALYRGMYADLSRRWVEDGRRQHLVTVFASDTPAFDACVSLGYGAVGMDTLRGMDPLPAESPVEIRRATPADADLVAPLESALRDHLASAPTFLPRDLEEPLNFTEEWLDAEWGALWLAMHAGEAGAFLCMAGSHGQVLPTQADDIISIIGAYTMPELRGAGVGASLLNVGLAWARKAGYTRCAVDFETANVSGSGFWLAKGFRPVTRSLYRHVHDTGLG